VYRNNLAKPSRVHELNLETRVPDAQVWFEHCEPHDSPLNQTSVAARPIHMAFHLVAHLGHDVPVGGTLRRRILLEQLVVQVDVEELLTIQRLQQ